MFVLISFPQESSRVRSSSASTRTAKGKTKAPKKTKERYQGLRLKIEKGKKIPDQSHEPWDLPLCTPLDQLRSQHSKDPDSPLHDRAHQCMRRTSQNTIKTSLRESTTNHRRRRIWKTNKRMKERQGSMARQIPAAPRSAHYQPRWLRARCYCRPMHSTIARAQNPTVSGLVFRMKSPAGRIGSARHSAVQDPFEACKCEMRTTACRSTAN